MNNASGSPVPEFLIFRIFKRTEIGQPPKVILDLIFAVVLQLQKLDLLHAKSRLYLILCILRFGMSHRSSQVYLIIQI